MRLQRMGFQEGSKTCLQLPLACGGAAQAAHPGPAVLGIALVAMAEDLGATMAHRALEHLLQYGEPAARCAPQACHRHGVLCPGGRHHAAHTAYAVAM